MPKKVDSKKLVFYMYYLYTDGSVYLLNDGRMYMWRFYSMHVSVRIVPDI